MKGKLFLSIVLFVFLFYITGCAKGNSDAKIEDNIIATPTITELATPAIEEPEATKEPKTEIKPTEELIKESEPTEKPNYPILDGEMTDALTDMMYASFGGSGNEQFAASWYKYIDYWEIYQNEDFYSGVLYLKERPYDASARLLLSKYYSDEELDILCPILMNVGVTLSLDDVDLCLIGELLYKIKTKTDSSTYYYALGTLDIPVYDFISDGFGKSVSDVKSAISKNNIPGKEAYACLIDYMAFTYKDSFDGLSLEKTKAMSMAAIANFKDVRVEVLTVFDQDGKLINTFEKLN